MSTKINHKKIDDIIKRNVKLFDKAGVLTVRPGYKMTGGWITDKPAIVATVDKKLDGLDDEDKLPSEVEDYPVDVREATGLQRLRKSNLDSYDLVKAHGRAEYNEPEWQYERNVPNGELTNKPKSALKGSSASHLSKPQLRYTSPTNAKLTKFTGTTTIIACASPDDGFDLLKTFLSQTKTNLTIGMYDFTSGDILNQMIGAVGKPKNLNYTMVLDHPPRNPTANQTDDKTRQDILAADANAKINWALTRNDPVATEWIFPSAYHIKVAVRDGSAFWLSSGNFNVSNEPNLAANNPPQGSIKNADRDWHVVILNQQLAETYEAFIQNDFKVASAYQSIGSPALRTKIQKAMKEHVTFSNKSSHKPNAVDQGKKADFVMQKQFLNVQVSIQPLLTPDKGTHTTMYVDNVLNLINSAKHSVYMQTQYIHPTQADPDFLLLVEALSNAHKKGLDVRLITSQYENTAQWIEQMKVYDLDQVLKIQERVHNKGIVVDSSVVMVSSQNWSGDGTLRNRDAGVIIENAEIATYFQNIFIYDWVNQANEKIVDVSYPSKTKSPSKAKSKGTNTKIRKRIVKKK